MRKGNRIPVPITPRKSTTPQALRNALATAPSETTKTTRTTSSSTSAIRSNRLRRASVVGTIRPCQCATRSRVAIDVEMPDSRKSRPSHDESDQIGRLVTASSTPAISYTHLRAHETPEHLVCRLLLEKKKK